MAIIPIHYCFICKLVVLLLIAPAGGLDFICLNPRSVWQIRDLLNICERSERMHHNDLKSIVVYLSTGVHTDTFWSICLAYNDLLTELPNSEKKAPMTIYLSMPLTSCCCELDSWLKLGQSKLQPSQFGTGAESHIVGLSHVFSGGPDDHEFSSGDQRRLVSRERGMRPSWCVVRKCDMRHRGRVWVTFQVLISVSSCCPAKLLPLGSGKYHQPALQIPSHR